MPTIIDLTPQPLFRLMRSVEALIEGQLWRKVVAGLVLGTAAGFTLGPDLGWVSPETATVAVRWAELPGRLFLATVQMIVVPLVFASIIAGLAASENTDKLRALGLRAGAYFATTSVVAIVIGLGVALLIRPGTLINRDLVQTTQGAPSPAEPRTLPGLAEVPETLVSLLPGNPLASLAAGEMLQVVLFAFVMGTALVVMPVDKARPLLDLLESLQNVCMTVVQWAMRLAPIAVFGLSIGLTAQLGTDALLGMAAYVGTVVAGLAILVAFYLLTVALLARRSPFAFLRATAEAQLLGFSTSSSAAVMPLSTEIAEHKLGVRPETSRFVIPLGATINMDGTALYQAVAVVFLAQVYGVDLGLAGLAIVVVTTAAASIGAPAAPGVGIVILAGILESAGIPGSGVALLLGVDRLLDMTRTAVNVTGDLAASVILDRWLAPIATQEGPSG